MTDTFTLNSDSTEVVESIKAGLEAAFEERNISPPANQSTGFRDANIKIQKLSYRVIEHFDLPVIRTWYRYGQFEPYNILRPKYVEPKELQFPQQTVPSGEYGEVSRNEIKGYFVEMDDLMVEWEKPLFSFLQDNYEKESDDDFREIYLANLGILKVLEDIRNNSKLSNSAGKYADQIKSPSIDLWHEMKHSKYFNEDEINFVRDFLDDLQTGLITLAAEENPDGPQVSTIKKSWDIYHNNVWPWPAMEISLREAKGPQNELKHDFLPEGRNYLNLYESSFPSALSNWQRQLREVSLVSGPITHQSVRGRIPNPIGSLEKSAIDPASNDNR